MSSVTIHGDTELMLALKKFDISMDNAIDEAVFYTAENVRKTAIDSIRLQSQGKPIISYRKKGGLTGSPHLHVQSKKGDAPNTDTGDLVDSIKSVHKRGSKTAEVGTGLKYGLYLETVLNRPWLIPAKDLEVSNFNKLLRNVMRQKIDEAAR